MYVQKNKRSLSDSLESTLFLFKFSVKHTISLLQWSMSLFLFFKCFGWHSWTMFEHLLATIILVTEQ